MAVTFLNFDGTALTVPRKTTSSSSLHTLGRGQSGKEARQPSPALGNNQTQPTHLFIWARQSGGVSVVLLEAAAAALAASTTSAAEDRNEART